MKKSILILPLFIAGLLFAQTPELEHLGEAFFPGLIWNQDTTGGSDLWVYVGDDGEEYILAGVKDGVGVVRASDMTILTTVEGPQHGDQLYHRDIKTYKDYAFVTSEMEGPRRGIQILDLSGLPDTVVYVKSLTDQIVRSHNLSIDTARHRLYFTGGAGGDYGGIYDILNPENPVAIARLPEFTVHDIFARNDTAWFASSDHFSMWDMADPTNPRLLAYLTDPDFGYCHTIWPTHDGKHFVTTEETPQKTVKIWAWEGLDDSIRLVSEFLGTSSMAHNAHVEGDSIYLSHYTSGVLVVDISDISNPVPVAQYDSHPSHDNDGYIGCWGIYPHAPSRYIYASDIEGQVMKFRFANSTSIQPSSTRLPVLLFPNPGTSPSLGFHLKTAGKVSVRWVDIQGKLLSSTSEVYTTGNHRIGVDAKAWPSGTYFFHIETAEGGASGSWIKD